MKMEFIRGNPTRSICNVISLTLLLTLLPVTGSAVEFFVNSTVDAVDSNPGNGLCETVNNNCSLRAAIQEANALSGLDKVSLPQGVFVLSLGALNENESAQGDLDILDDLEVSGQGADKTTISGGINSFRIFELLEKDLTASSLFLNSLTLEEGSENTDGSLIRSVHGGSLTIKNSVLTQGGQSSRAVYVRDGKDLIIENSSVTENYFGVDISSTRTLIRNSDFSANGVGISGSINKGALQIAHSNAVITGCHFHDNNGDRNVIVVHTDLDMRNSVLERNNTRLEGGALELTFSTVFLKNITVSNNSTTSRGGGILVEHLVGDSFYMRDSVIENNVAPFSGGGMMIGTQWGKVSIVDSRIINNETDGEGGGIYAPSLKNFPFRLRNTEVSGNTAEIGAGIYLPAGDASADIINTTISDNTASQSGGGVFFDSVRESSRATVTNSTIAFNSAPVSQGGNVNSNARFQLLNTIVSGGIGGDCTGTIETLGSNLDSDDSCQLTDSSDQSGINPVILPLSEETGVRRVHQLDSTSPAIDAANITFCPDIDQVHHYRGQDSCDIGASEFGAIPISAGILSFSDTSYVVQENGVTAIITVNRLGGTEGQVNLTYRDQRRGTAGLLDYLQTDGRFVEDFNSGILTWGHGDSLSKTFEIEITDDALEEGSETILLGFTAIEGGATLNESLNQATLTILDDELSTGTFSFASAVVEVTEEDAQVIIKVVRTGGSHGGVNIEYETIDDSATAGEDYALTSGTLAFDEGILELDIVIPILNDSKIEPDESFTVKLTNNAVGASILDSAAKVVIKGNDNENNESGDSPPANPGNLGQLGSESGGGSASIYTLSMMMLFLLHRLFLLRRVGCVQLYAVQSLMEKKQ